MNAAALSTLGRELGIEPFGETAAHRLIGARGAHDAEQLVRGGAALLDLAGAVGLGLDFERASERLLAADLIYELAADRLLEPMRKRKQHAFTTAFERLEKAFFGDEAKARHAVFVGHLIDGGRGIAKHYCPQCSRQVPTRDVAWTDDTARHVPVYLGARRRPDETVMPCNAELRSYISMPAGEIAVGGLGYQASMLLIAAEDAGLRKPDAIEYRRKVAEKVGWAIARRYPVHAAPDVVVRDADEGDRQTKHELVVAGARRDEQEVQDLAVGRIPDLAVRIDRLRDRRMAMEVRRILNEIRKRLAQRAEAGWTANPGAYEQRVIQPAAEAARNAA